MSIMKSSRSESRSCLNLDTSEAAKILIAISGYIQRNENLTFSEVNNYLDIQDKIRKAMKFEPYS